MGSSFSATLMGFLSRYPEILLAVIIFLFLRQWSRAGGLPVNWPGLGMIPYVFIKAGDLHEWCTDVLRRSGCTFVFKGPPTAVDVLLTCDPANVNHVFNVSFANYPKGGDFAEIFDILGGGIFNSDEESWSFQRKMAHSLLRHTDFKEFTAKVSEEKVVNDLLPLMDRFAASGEVVDMQDVFMRLTFDTTCMLVFGVDPGCLATNFPVVPFAKALDDAEEAIFFRHTRPRAWTKILKTVNVGQERTLSLSWKVIDRFISQYVDLARRKRDQLSTSSVPRYDLLSSYIEGKEEITKAGFDHDKFLRDTTLNLMLAGRDTTSSALTWFFWLVARNPTVEAKILEELTSVKKVNDDPTSLVYLHAALCESMRLYPPVPFEHKAAREPESLPSGVEVHENRRIAFSLYSMGRMEGIWGNDCEEFRPERWISESTGRLTHVPSYKFLVFNSGPRTCLGKHVALTQMKHVAAAVFRGYHLEVVEGHKARPKLSIILYMKDGLKMRIKKRVNEEQLMKMRA